jgi:prolyl-tRNA synthetase
MMPICVYDQAGNVIATDEHAASSKSDKLACACRGAELVAHLMNYRRLFVAVALIAVRLVVPFASAEPRAYDTVFYKGKAAGLKIVFEFDHGYVEASNVKITGSASGKTTKFYLSGRDGQMGTGKMRFAPVKGAKKEVLLEMDPFGNPMSTVNGSYITAGKTVPFTLTKRKKH